MQHGMAVWTNWFQIINWVNHVLCTNAGKLNFVVNMNKITSNIAIRI